MLSMTRVCGGGGVRAICRTRVFARSKKNMKLDFIYDDSIGECPRTFAVRSYTPPSLSSTNMKKELMKPRNAAQSAYVNLIKDPSTPIVIATGPAGTGKSCLAVSAAIDMLKNGAYERVVISRPAVSVEEEHGFLPGSLNEKMDPWMRPLFDTFYKYYTPDAVNRMIQNKIIDICPLAYLRGRTLENSFIIIDESQNCSVNQMLMIMTRIGEGSKMIITGDPMQHDRGHEMSGLTDLMERLEKHGTSPNSDIDDDIAYVKFTTNHIERHPVIKSVLKLYTDADS